MPYRQKYLLKLLPRSGSSIVENDSDTNDILPRSGYTQKFECAKVELAD